MSSTNKTTNYELSQFIGADKPAWLGDYNSDMSKIDAQMKLNADGVASASGTATSASTAIGTLSNLTTTVKTDLVSAINEVDGNADTAQGTATSANNTATQAKNKADSLEAYLTLGTTATGTFSASTGTVATGHNSVSVRTNATKSLGKIYGDISIESIPSNTSTITLTSGDTGLRPSSAITINGACLTRILNRNDGVYRDVYQSYTLNTDGTITLSINATNAYQVSVFFLAVVLFLIDFGDIPVPE